MKNARNHGLLRVLRLADRLRERRWTVHELSREFTVTTRTIRRDLELLEAVPMPIQKMQGGGGKDAPSLWWIA